MANSNNLYAAAADCTSKHINLSSLGLCVWDSNADGIPDGSGLVCATDYLSVWSRPYGATNLSSQCLSVSYFPSAPQFSKLLMPTPLYVVTCNVAWTTNSSGQLSCPVGNQIVSDISTGVLWHGFDAYVLESFNNINPQFVWWIFGGFAGIWALGVFFGLIQRFLRRFS